MAERGPGTEPATGMDSFLDENVGSDTRLLPDLLRSLTKEKHELQEQVWRLGRPYFFNKLVWFPYSHS